MIEQSEKAVNYLDHAKKDIHVIMEYFRVLAKKQVLIHRIYFLSLFYLHQG
jgi:hypothetical protein